MKQIKVTVKGISSLLMHKWNSGGDDTTKDSSPEQLAETAAYRTETGELYVPAQAIARALVSAAAFSKGKGRASLQKEVGGAVFVLPEYVLLGKKDYVVDSRPVVIPATKGRILRHRPRIEDWSLTFTCEYDDQLLSEKQMREIVDNCGARVGLLDFRPEKKGPFGRFMVTAWN